MQGPREVKKRELVFLQFRLNESSEDFSAIDYLLFSSFQEFLQRWRFQSAVGQRCTVPWQLIHRGPGLASWAAMGGPPAQGLAWTLVAPGNLSSLSEAGLVWRVLALPVLGGGVRREELPWTMRAPGGQSLPRPALPCGVLGSVSSAQCVFATRF